MNPDDEVCLCFHVSLRKVVSFCRRQRPGVPSLISQCLGAGTGCGWCIPFLRKLHDQVEAGVAEPDLPVSPRQYAARRLTFRQTGRRDDAPPPPEAKGE